MRGRDVPVAVLLRGEESGGHLAAIELVLATRTIGPPLHVHPAHGEGFYVLEGEVAIRIGDERLTGVPGTFAFAASGVAHTFANLSDIDARLLVLCTPAGFETYFDQLAADYERGQWPSSAQPDSAAAMTVGPRIESRRRQR